MDMLFNQASVASPGTYNNMKQVFKHRSLHGNVQNNVQHVWDMIQIQLTLKCITIYHTIHTFIGLDLTALGCAMHLRERYRRENKNTREKRVACC